MSVFDNMTNAEIRIKMKEMENEFEVLKKSISELCERMDDMNDKYNTAQNVLNKRSKGII